jgi:hypothetical protein
MQLRAIFAAIITAIIGYFTVQLIQSPDVNLPLALLASTLFLAATYTLIFDNAKEGLGIQRPIGLIILAAGFFVKALEKSDPGLTLGMRLVSSAAVYYTIIGGLFLTITFIAVGAEYGIDIIKWFGLTNSQWVLFGGLSFLYNAVLFTLYNYKIITNGGYGDISALLGAMAIMCGIQRLFKMRRYCDVLFLLLFAASFAHLAWGISSNVTAHPFALLAALTALLFTAFAIGQFVMEYVIRRN